VRYFERMQKQDEQTYFTKIEAAMYLRCSPRSVDNFLARNELRAYKLTSKKLLLARDDLDAFVRRHRADADIDNIVEECMCDVHK